MTNDTAKPSSLLQSVTRMIENAANDGTGYDTVIQVLSLVCLVLIMSRNQTALLTTSPTTATASNNPIQKLLGELSKGDGNGPSPEALMALLPLLNNPQLKSKLNSTNIGAVLGMLNSLSGANSDKHETKTDKSESKTDHKPDTPAATITQPEHGPDPEAEPVINPESHTQTLTAENYVQPEHTVPAPPEPEKKSTSRYLNWKTNF